MPSLNSQTISAATSGAIAKVTDLVLDSFLQYSGVGPGPGTFQFSITPATQGATWSGSFALYYSPDGTNLYPLNAASIQGSTSSGAPSSGAYGSYTVQTFGGTTFLVCTSLASGTPIVSGINGPAQGVPGSTPGGFLSSFLSVAAYGAKGDGVTDDTAALQAAINAAGASGSVGSPAVVWFPKPNPTYIISSALVVPSNVHCLGWTPASTYQPTLTQMTYGQPCFYMQNCSNSTIENLSGQYGVCTSVPQYGSATGSTYLSAAASAGQNFITVRSTSGMSPGDTIAIDQDIFIEVFVILSITGNSVFLARNGQGPDVVGNLPGPATADTLGLSHPSGAWVRDQLEVNWSTPANAVDGNPGRDFAVFCNQVGGSQNTIRNCAAQSMNAGVKLRGYAYANDVQYNNFGNIVDGLEVLACAQGVLYQQQSKARIQNINLQLVTFSQDGHLSGAGGAPSHVIYGCGPVRATGWGPGIVYTGAANVASNLSSGTWKEYISSGSAATMTVSACTNATPAVATVSAPYTLTNGQQVVLSGVGNVPNGTYYAKTTGYTSTTFGLYTDAYLTVPVTGSGTFTGGGTATGQNVGANPTTSTDIWALYTSWVSKSYSAASATVYGGLNYIAQVTTTSTPGADNTWLQTSFTTQNKDCVLSNLYGDGANPITGANLCVAKDISLVKIKFDTGVTVTNITGDNFVRGLDLEQLNNSKISGFTLRNFVQSTDVDSQCACIAVLDCNDTNISDGMITATGQNGIAWNNPVIVTQIDNLSDGNRTKFSNISALTNFSAVPGYVFKSIGCNGDIFEDISYNDLGGLNPNAFVLSYSTSYFTGSNGVVSNPTVQGTTGFGITVQQNYNSARLAGTPSLLSCHQATSDQGTGTINGFLSKVTAVNASLSPYQILATDSQLNVDTSGGAVILKLPQPSIVGNGWEVGISDSTGNFGTNNCSVQQFNNEYVVGLKATLPLSAPWGVYSLKTDGTNWLKVGGGKNLASRSATANASAFTWTCPAGITTVNATARGASGGGGGGGAGGGGSTGAGAAGGGSGAQGSSVMSFTTTLTVTPGSSYTVTPGLAGAAGAAGVAAAASSSGSSGGAGGTGGNGGATTFGSLLSAYGGRGGGGGGGGQLSTIGAAGTGTAVLIPVSNGAPGGLTNAAGSSGGSGTATEGGARTSGGAGGASGNSGGGGGGGGAPGNSAADGPASGTSPAGGAGGASNANGNAGAAGVLSPGLGVGGGGGSGGGGGGTLLTTGSTGGAGGAGGAGCDGSIYFYWFE